MAYYLDTSALLPYYRREASSNIVQSFLVAQREPMGISYLTRVEVASAVSRWVRDRELTNSQANRAVVAFEEDIAQGRFTLKLLSIEVFEQAWDWLRTCQTPLRALDSLHLACAANDGSILVSFDRQLLSAAESLGLNVREPG